MSSYSTNTMLYNLHSENEAQKILSHFNTQQIVDFIQDSLNKRFRAFVFPLPNIINSLEQDFKNSLFYYPDQEIEIRNIKVTTYQNVLNILGEANLLSITFQDDMDYFSAAYYLYDVFVSNFITNISAFFTNYIIRERNSLYQELALEEYKKSRDSSTIYGKKMYKNQKMNVINANIEYVIDNICKFEIPFEVVLQFICQDQSVINYILSFALPKTNFFRDVYVSCMSDPVIRQHVMADVRLQIHTFASQE